MSARDFTPDERRELAAALAEIRDAAALLLDVDRKVTAVRQGGTATDLELDHAGDQLMEGLGILVGAVRRYDRAMWRIVRNPEGN